MIRCVQVVVAAAACGLLFSCTPVERDRCSVEGTARFKGQPLAGFDVALYSEKTGGGSAEVRPDGTFKFFGPMQEGEYLAFFVIPDDVKGAARAKLEAMDLPVKYRRSETSDIKVTISPGPNNLDIDVKP